MHFNENLICIFYGNFISSTILMFLLRAGLQQKANISAEEWNDSCIRKQTNGGRPKKISNTESSLDTDDF